MGARGSKAGRVTRIGRFVRGRRFDRNPLRRASDRIETAVLAVLVLAFLVGAPFAVTATGAWVHGMAQRAEVSQQASRSQVQAVVLTVTAQLGGEDRVSDEAQARWRAPDGREVTGEVSVPAGTKVGQQVPVWTDQAGDLTTAPLADSQVGDQTVLGEILSVIALVGVLALIGELACWVLNRRRMADWDADWHATGPRWSTRA